MQGQKQDEEVGRDVEARGRQGLRLAPAGEAGARDVGVPVAGDGHALEDGEGELEGVKERVGGDEPDGGVEHDAVAVADGDEHAQELEEYGQLGGQHAHAVEGFENYGVLGWGALG